MAAQIGKSLLDRNRELDRRLKESENQFVAAMETFSDGGLERSLWPHCSRSFVNRVALDASYHQDGRRKRVRECLNSGGSTLVECLISTAFN
ncbi:unnamed protein product [Rodentolepis nana]|uniref:Uncharacterized protein n=1 Tax=Rodentolepis nana TaxID=102285 RepID=A0A0R3TXD4_RODNA|nr:unnamed protein product [Rodentolepis nana]